MSDIRLCVKGLGAIESLALLEGIQPVIRRE